MMARREEQRLKHIWPIILMEGEMEIDRRPVQRENAFGSSFCVCEPPSKIYLGERRTKAEAVIPDDENGRRDRGLF
jgi:hypothetical protein